MEPSFGVTFSSVQPSSFFGNVLASAGHFFDSSSPTTTDLVIGIPSINFTAAGGAFFLPNKTPGPQIIQDVLNQNKTLLIERQDNHQTSVIDNLIAGLGDIDGDNFEDVLFSGVSESTAIAWIINGGGKPKGRFTVDSIATWSISGPICRARTKFQNLVRITPGQ